MALVTKTDYELRLDMYRKELRGVPDDDLWSHLAGYKQGTDRYLVVQAEIDRRKQDKEDAKSSARQKREDERFRKTEFRSWVSVGISVVALIVALGVALYK